MHRNGPAIAHLIENVDRAPAGPHEILGDDLDEIDRNGLGQIILEVWNPQAEPEAVKWRDCFFRHRLTPIGVPGPDGTEGQPGT